MKTAFLAAPLPFIVLLSFLVVAPGCPPPSKGWVRLHGGDGSDYGFDVQQTAETCWLLSVKQSSDGGYIFGGDQGNAALLLKSDEDGVQEWSRRFGGTGSLRSEGHGVVESPTGGYCLVGSQYSGSTEDWSMYTVKTDENGDTGLPLPVLWSS